MQKKYKQTFKTIRNRYFTTFLAKDIIEITHHVINTAQLDALSLQKTFYWEAEVCTRIIILIHRKWHRKTWTNCLPHSTLARSKSKIASAWGQWAFPVFRVPCKIGMMLSKSIFWSGPKAALASLPLAFSSRIRRSIILTPKAWRAHCIIRLFFAGVQNGW